MAARIPVFPDTAQAKSDKYLVFSINNIQALSRGLSAIPAPRCPARGGTAGGVRTAPRTAPCPSLQGAPAGCPARGSRRCSGACHGSFQPVPPRAAAPLDGFFRPGRAAAFGGRFGELTGWPRPPLGAPSHPAPAAGRGREDARRLRFRRVLRPREPAAHPAAGAGSRPEPPRPRGGPPPSKAPRLSPGAAGPPPPAAPGWGRPAPSPAAPWQAPASIPRTGSRRSGSQRGRAARPGHRRGMPRQAFCQEMRRRVIVSLRWRTSESAPHGMEFTTQWTRTRPRY